jgi:N-acetylmuramoyl-L-alanine amidase
MRLLALALIAPTVLAQSTHGTSGTATVTAVRTWPAGDVTRVAIEVSGPFDFKYDRLQNPYRVYFDIKGAKPRIDGKSAWIRDVADKLVTRIRVAETTPGTTRVVVDVTGPVDVTPSQLTSPSRLMIELRLAALMPASPVATESAALPVQPGPLAKPEVPVESPRVAEVRSETPKAEMPKAEVRKPAPKVESPRVAETRSEVPKPDLPNADTGRAEVRRPAPKLAPDPAPVKESAAVRAAELAKAARPTSSGSSSLTRALGLKLNRIVLDAGHGGHDQGTSGPKGLVEKDLVLDVTLRLGKLIEQGLGAEVIYTRTDDTFIPLEGRTDLANEKKADLFLSIHANSSSVPRITGVETYYLNFTDSKEAMDLASRENAASQRSIFELQDLLQKITLHEKIDESREFAKRVQTAMFAFSLRTFPGQRDRGIKKAPFVVLIGAQMPSVLAEIGFVTSPGEEQLLRRPDYRQKIAESLYKGISKYAESLSHFQLALTQ